MQIQLIKCNKLEYFIFLSDFYLRINILSKTAEKNKIKLFVI